MISIIIPAFNAESTIRCCIESLLAQTYNNLEIIVVNDGSCDYTENLIIGMMKKDKRIKLVNQNNAGVSAARNKGIEASTGEYICFVDSDDMVDPHFLETLLKLYVPQCLPVVDIVRNDFDGSALRCIESQYTIGSDFVMDYFCGDLGQGIAFSVCNKLFLKETVLVENIKFDENLTVGEDMMFVFRYLCCCHTVRISTEVAYYYNIDNSSAMNSKRDYTMPYEELLSAMKCCCQQGKKIDDYVLSCWALNIMTSILTNPYVLCLSFSKFKMWWNELALTELYQAAKRGEVSGGFNHKLFQYALKYGYRSPIFLFLKLNNLRIKRK